MHSFDLRFLEWKAGGCEIAAGTGCSYESYGKGIGRNNSKIIWSATNLLMAIDVK